MLLNVALLLCITARKLTKRRNEVNDFPPNVACCRNRLSGIYRHLWCSQRPLEPLELLEQTDPSHDVAVARGGSCSALPFLPPPHLCWRRRPGQTRPAQLGCKTV